MSKIVINPKKRLGRILPADARTSRHVWIDRYPADDKRTLRTFECSINSETGAPIIRSHQTGNYCVFRWIELIQTAIDQGIETVSMEGKGTNEHQSYDSSLGKFDN